ncbi:MAG: hypothetical protein QOF84_3067 [Streptomyces sp.]|jgi:phage-related minor tail protein|nr:hypothetical protein [Streptomyces sp.]
MGSNDQYGVDLSALDQVVKELNQILSDMGGPKSKAQHGTYLAPGQLGKGFSEADELLAKHGEMKSYIENDIISKIENLIDDFGKKSKKTKEAYEDAEASTKASMQM